MSLKQNSLVKQQESNTFSGFLTSEGVKKKINEIVGGKDGQRFITSIISAVSANPELAKCEHSTILSAALIGESLKLSVSPQLGQFYIVPFNDNRNNRVVAQFQIGYKGYLQLAIRSGYYKKINVVALKKGEFINYNPLTEEIETKLINDDEIRENTETTGYYAMFEYLNGFRKTMYWSKKKMEIHATKYSRAYAAKKGYSFWEKDFDAMAFKTMLRQLISKWGIMTVELQQAFEKDIIEPETSDYIETNIDKEDIKSDPTDIKKDFFESKEKE
jgi:recombination protein RecT